MAETRPAWVCTRAPVYMLWLLACCFSESPSSERQCISDSSACSWDSFPPFGLSCPASVWVFWGRLIVFFCHVWLLPLGGLLCSEEEMEGSVDLRRGYCQGIWEEGRGGHWDWDVFYERRTIFNKKHDWNQFVI